MINVKCQTTIQVDISSFYSVLVVGAGTDASRTVYFKKETNNGETNNVEMLCCNHKVHHFKTSRILNNSSKNI